MRTLHGMISSAKQAAVIGGGIVGLAVARELTIRYPGLQVTVFDKEDHVAAHQSGHNSGVVHAGLYYAPGSLKARLCVRGGSLLREFCQQHDIRLRELGKLVVASSDEELPGLAEIERRALANGVPGIRRVARPEIAEIEPYVRGAAALYSPHTASVDFVGMCQALAREVTSAGGTVRLGTHIRSVRRRPRRGGPVGQWRVDLRSADRLRGPDRRSARRPTRRPGRHADRSLPRGILRAPPGGPGSGQGHGVPGPRPPVPVPRRPPDPRRR